MIFNTHTHLNDKAFRDNYKEVIEKSLDMGMRLVVVGYDFESSVSAINIAEQFEGVYAAVGLHPTDSSVFTLKYMEQFNELLKNPKVIAIGECGLDFHWDTCPKDLQIDSFNYQIELAIKHDLPLIVHSRDSIEETYNLLAAHGTIKGIMHCYSGSVEMVHRFLNLGMYISLAGPVTFKNAKTPKEVAKHVPIEKLLVETDCPYLTPHPFRGKENRAYFITYVVDEIARLREMTSDQVAEATWENANNIFGLKE